MTYLRSALYMTYLVVTVIPYALCCVLWAPLPLSWRYRLTLGWPRMPLWLLPQLPAQPRSRGRGRPQRPMPST